MQYSMQGNPQGFIRKAFEVFYWQKAFENISVASELRVLWAVTVILCCELCFPFLIVYRNSRRLLFYGDKTTSSLFKSYFVNQMRASLSIDLAHSHFTSSDWFGLSIPTGMFKISIPVIDNFDTYMLFLSHLQCKKDVDETEQAQCRISAMVGAGLLALQGEAGRTGLVQPGEGVVLGGPSSSLQYPWEQNRGNGARFFMVMHS